MNTIDAVKGQWEKIFAHYGLPPITGRKHFKGKCPICGQKGKFRIDDKDGRGTYICTCGSGNGFQLLERTQGKDFKTLADEIDVLIGNHREKEIPTTKEKPKGNLFQRITGCYSKLSILKNTPAMQYLQNRGIFELPADNVRYCDHQPVRNSSDKFQAISLDEKEVAEKPLRIGLSTEVTVDTVNLDGKVLSQSERQAPAYHTDALTIDMSEINSLINEIIEQNAG